MEVAAALKEATAARPGARPSEGSSFVRMAWREGLRRGLRLLLQAFARFRRLLGILARQPSLLLRAVFRAPCSLASLVQSLLSSRLARILVAAAASLICISLQYHRPTVADIQLSSSISLLFGMIKLQGSLALQLGPPESIKSGNLDLAASHGHRNRHRHHHHQQQQLNGGDELRINCPKDLKESIVRFLESQALRSPNTAVTITEEPSGQRLPAATQQQQPQPPGDEEAAAHGPSAEDHPVLAEMLGAAAAAAVEPSAEDAEGMSWGGGSVESGGSGFESCCSDSSPDASSNAGAVPPSSGEVVLPPTPPLVCSPPSAKAAAAAGCPASDDTGSGGRQGEEEADVEGCEEGVAPFENKRVASRLLTAASSAAAVGTAVLPGRGGSGKDDGIRKSPDSILGLRNLGLEGWAESRRRWESRYLED